MSFLRTFAINYSVENR